MITSFRIIKRYLIIINYLLGLYNEYTISKKSISIEAEYWVEEKIFK